MLKEPFAILNPDMILSCAEQALERPLLNVCRPHSSYINRVYELQDEEGEFFIVKFYRPGRWTMAAIEDELQFLRDCRDRDIPVIAPLQQADGQHIGTYKGIHFALFPKCGGRLVDEYDDDQWLELGRLIGRVHSAGETRRADNRLHMHPLHSTRSHVEFILSNQLVHQSVVEKFREVTDTIIKETAELFTDSGVIRIHGDCHSGNLIYRPGESFYIIDFDDMVCGPPVQDCWMLLPGPLEESRVELSLLLEGYETFRPFDRRSLNLIEPLRAMRFIHYISWCGWQFIEDGETRVDESFGNYSYWEREVADLEDQMERIRKSGDFN